MTHRVTLEFTLKDPTLDPKTILWPLLLDGEMTILNWHCEPACEPSPMTWRETLVAVALVVIPSAVILYFNLKG